MLETNSKVHFWSTLPPSDARRGEGVVVVVVVLVVVVVVSEPFGVYIYRSLFNNTSKTDVAPCYKCTDWI